MSTNNNTPKTLEPWKIKIKYKNHTGIVDVIRKLIVNTDCNTRIWKPLPVTVFTVVVNKTATGDFPKSLEPDSNGKSWSICGKLDNYDPQRLLYNGAFTSADI
jgi:hypothetical protein